jgi:hypothetical protein
MPLEYPGSLQILDANAFERPQVLEIPLGLASPNDPNLLCMYTGTALGTLKGVSPADWNRATLHIKPPTGGRRWTDDPNRGPGFTLLMNGVAIATLSSIFNVGPADNAGWAVDGASLRISPRSSRGLFDEFLEVEGLIAVRDVDGFIFRFSYHATALGRVL